MDTLTTTPPVSSLPAEIPLDRIVPSKTNPRKTFPAESLAELAESIKKLGVLQPILLRPAPGAPLDPEPFYEIVAGERRFRASKLAGMTTIPATVRDISDMEMLELQIIENLQREDLHPLEEAESYEALLEQHKEDPDYTVDHVAATLGKSRAYIYARMKLCALRQAARAALKTAGIKISRAQSSFNADQRDKEKKTKAERTYRRALLTEIHRNARAHLAAGGILTIEEMREIAYKMYRDIGADLRPTIAALWAWPAQDLEAVEHLVQQQNPAELALLMLMCVRAPNTYCGPWSNSLDTPDELLQACAQYDVDPKEIKVRTQPPTVRPAPRKKAAEAQPPASLPATEAEASA